MANMRRPEPWIKWIDKEPLTGEEAEIICEMFQKGTPVKDIRIMVRRAEHVIVEVLQANGLMNTFSKHRTQHKAILFRLRRL